MADSTCNEAEIIPWPDRLRRTGELVISLGGSVNGKALPRDGSGSIPPLKLGAKTITKIRKAWEVP